MDVLFGANPNILVQSSWVAVGPVDRGGIGLIPIIEAVAYTLFLYFITSQALQAAMSGRGEQLRALMIKAVLAAALFANVPWIQSQMLKSWVGLYDWSTTAAMSMIPAKSQAVTDALGEASEGAWSLFAINAVNSILTSDGPSQGAQGVMEATGGAAVGSILRTQGINSPLLKFGLKSATRTLRMLILPVVAMFMVLIYGSGLIVIIGALFFPLAVALIASGTGFKVVTSALSKVFGAYGTLIVIPMIFLAISELAIFQPIIAFTEGLQETVKAWTTMIETAQASGDPVVWYNPATWRIPGVDINIADTVNTIFTTLDNLFDTVFTGLILALGGIIAAFVLMMQVEGYVGGIIGGIAGGAAQATGSSNATRAVTGISKTSQETYKDGKEYVNEMSPPLKTRKGGGSEPPPNNRS